MKRHQTDPPAEILSAASYRANHEEHPLPGHIQYALVDFNVSQQYLPSQFGDEGLFTPVDPDKYECVQATTNLHSQLYKCDAALGIRWYGISDQGVVQDSELVTIVVPTAASVNNPPIPAVSRFVQLSDMFDTDAVDNPAATMSQTATATSDNLTIRVSLKKQVKSHCKLLGPQYRVISRQVSKKGAREYGICWMPLFFWKYTQTISGNLRTFNEIVSKTEPCRLYLDLDLAIVGKTDKLKDLDVAGQRKLSSKWIQAMMRVKVRLRKFCQFICYKLKQYYGLMTCTESQCRRDNTMGSTLTHTAGCLRTCRIQWTVLDASNEHKVSKHVIFTIHNDSVLFTNKGHVGHFIKYAIAQWLSTIQSAKQVALNVANLLSITSKHLKCDSTINGAKVDTALSKGNVVGSEPQPITQQTKDWPLYDLSNLDYKWSDNEIDTLIANSVDLGIYVGEREFRMYESTKYDEARPLILDEVCKLHDSDGDYLDWKDLTPSVQSYCIYNSNHTRTRLGVYCKPHVVLPSERINNAIDPQEPMHYDDDDDDDEDSADYCVGDTGGGAPGTGKDDLSNTLAAGLYLFSAAEEDMSELRECITSNVTSNWLTKSLSDMNVMNGVNETLAFHKAAVNLVDIFYRTLIIPALPGCARENNESHWHYGLDAETWNTCRAHCPTVDDTSCVKQLLRFINTHDEMLNTKQSLLKRRSDILTRMKRTPRKHNSNQLTALSLACIQSVYYSTKPYGRKYASIFDDNNAIFDDAMTSNSNQSVISEGTNTIPDDVQCAHHTDDLPEDHLFEALSDFSKSSSLSEKNPSTSETCPKELMGVMRQYGDDPLGLRLIADISTSICHDTGMSEEGYALIYLSDKRSNDGMHYLTYTSPPEYKRCYLKGIRLGMHNNRHNNNNTYFVVCLNNGTYYQKCHDEDCKTYYACTLAGMCARKDPSQYALIKNQAKGPKRQLSEQLRIRALNFMQFNELLEHWDACQPMSAATAADNTAAV